MIESGMDRIIAVIRTEDQKVIFTHGSENFRKPPVEFLNGVAIAGGITPVPVFRIKIYQIGEDQSVEILLQGLDGLGYAIVIVLRMDCSGHTAAIENIPDLTDAIHFLAICLQLIQQCLFRWVQSIIMPVRCTIF